MVCGYLGSRFCNEVTFLSHVQVMALNTHRPVELTELPRHEVARESPEEEPRTGATAGTGNDDDVISVASSSLSETPESWREDREFLHAMVVLEARQHFVTMLICLRHLGKPLAMRVASYVPGPTEEEIGAYYVEQGLWEGRPAEKGNEKDMVAHDPEVDGPAQLSVVVVLTTPIRRQSCARFCPRCITGWDLRRWVQKWLVRCEIIVPADMVCLEFVEGGPVGFRLLNRHTLGEVATGRELRIAATLRPWRFRIP